MTVETGFWPLAEYENGLLTKVRKIKEIKSVEEYLKLQRRFSHILGNEQILQLWNEKYNKMYKNISC